jgi:S-adenosylmethionine:tRNA ribosyltransferase-isomerase
MHPKNLSITDFTYDLPDECIAKYPLQERDLSKLLIFKDGVISEDIYRKIAEHIPQNTLLVFNNTRVIPARIFFKNATGAKIEVFCLDPESQPLPSPKGETNAEDLEDMAAAMMQTGKARWNCLIGRAGKWKAKQLKLAVNDVELTAEIVDRKADAFVIQFAWQPAELTFAEVLDKTGMMPIPPYLRRESEELDQSRYQTVYAVQKGSVAAPTAGLHFTDEVMNRLKEKGVQSAYVTLHVGAGTFKPVKAEKMEGHTMHAEMIDVDVATIERVIRSLDGNIIAVGTTSMRTIESLFWMGVKAQLNPGAAIGELEVKQWDPYELPEQPSTRERTGEALKALLNWMHKHHMHRLLCKTQIMIAPGYELRVANAIITNFHQPASTLLLLVAAVIGHDEHDWRAIYNYALQNEFRFLSYGDGCLLWAAGTDTRIKT